jgi:hypothetical protein
MVLSIEETYTMRCFPDLFCYYLLHLEVITPYPTNIDDRDLIRFDGDFRLRRYGLAAGELDGLGFGLF